MADEKKIWQEEKTFRPKKIRQKKNEIYEIKKKIYEMNGFWAEKKKRKKKRKKKKRNY